VAIRVVIDTNVLLSALRSSRGASFRVLSLIDSGRFRTSLSVPLVIEHEAAAKRLISRGGLSSADVDAIIDYLCKVGEHHKIYFLWRPTLKDPKDDMVLELAVASHADAIVTFNRTDFKGARSFGIRVITPQQLLREIGEPI
jgi:putative PIN family toxin of toxin-antitoxin system